MKNEKQKAYIFYTPGLGWSVPLKLDTACSWADNMLAKIEGDRDQEAQDGTLFVQNLKTEISEIVEKLEKLLDAHLDGVISKEEYASKKQKLLN